MTYDWIKAKVERHINHSYTIKDILKRTGMCHTHFWRYCKERPAFKEWVNQTLEQNRRDKFERTVRNHFFECASVLEFLERSGISRYTWNRQMKLNPTLRKEVRKRIQEYRLDTDHAPGDMEVPTPEEQRQNYLNYLRKVAEKPKPVKPERREYERMNRWDWVMEAIR